ncbi:TonB-dependent receptor [bacterium]|nr:TonB-dependent receptor [bacterium]
MIFLIRAWRKLSSSSSLPHTLFALSLLGSFSYSNPNIDLVDTLETTQVTSSKVQKSNSEISGSEWATKQKSSLAASVSKEPGIHLRSLGPAPARPIFRGLGGDHIQVAEDKSTILDLSASSPDHATSLSSSQIKSIKLISGADLLEYSLSSTGLRIEANRGLFMTTPRATWNTRINSSFQSAHPGGMTSIQTEIPISDFTLRAQGSFLKQSNTQSPTKTLKNTQSDSYNYASALQWDPNKKTQTAFSFENSTSSYGIPGGFVGSHGQGVDISMKRVSYKLGSKFSLLNTNISQNLNFSEFNQIETEKNGPVGAEFALSQFGYLLNLKKELNSSFSIKSGIDLTQQSNQYGGFVYTPHTQRYTGALWTVLNKRSNQNTYKLSLRGEGFTDETTGIYAEKTSAQSRISHAGALEANLKLNPENTLDLKLTQTSKLPSQQELYNTGPHLAAYSYEKGNHKLKSEMGFGGEMSHKLHPKGFNLSSSVFSHYYPTFINSSPNGQINFGTQLPIYTLQNNEVLISGIEVGTEYKILSKLKLELKLDYTHGQNLELDEALSNIAPLRLQNNISYKYKQTELTLNNVYLHEQDRVSEFEENTEASFVSNFNVSHAIFGSGQLWRFNCGIENLWNTEWKNHLSRIKSIMDEPGRSYYIKVLWEN